VKPVSKIAAAAATATAAIALLAVPASAATANGWPGPAQHPVFVQTDNTAGNTIVAYEPTASGGLQQAGSTTASTIFTDTPGQISFTPGGTHLIVTTKAAANTIDVFQAGPFGPSAQPAITSLPGTVPFGFTFDQYGHLALAETGTDTVVTFSIAPDGTLTELGSAATGQKATCWITMASNGVLYASNAGSGTESALSTQPDGTVTLLGNTPTDAGTVDAAASADGQYLYVQAGGPGNVDAYSIKPDGSLAQTGTVTVPGAVGGEGIVAL
jgi:6-phosphogluconolactonase (cycloisomerase 2 family)